MNAQSTSIIVFGASGRMGARLCALAATDPTVQLLAAVVRDRSLREGQLVRDTADAAMRFVSAENAGKIKQIGPEVVIDFSSDHGALQALALASKRGAALVVGTTALAPSTLDALRGAAAKIPVLISPNTSMGVAVLADAVVAAARLLGPAFECSIVEAHHSRKTDAPSGTALRLAAAARSGGALVRDDQVLAIRGGDVIGEHTVRFAGPGEYVELTHRATSRDLFALGAIRAAKWLVGRAPKLYTIEDVLGLVKRSTQDRA